MYMMRRGKTTNRRSFGDLLRTPEWRSYRSLMFLFLSELFALVIYPPSVSELITCWNCTPESDFSAAVMKVLLSHSGKSYSVRAAKSNGVFKNEYTVVYVQKK